MNKIVIQKNEYINTLINILKGRKEKLGEIEKIELSNLMRILRNNNCLTKKNELDLNILINAIRKSKIPMKTFHNLLVYDI